MGDKVLIGLLQLLYIQGGVNSDTPLGVAEFASVLPVPTCFQTLDIPTT